HALEAAPNEACGMIGGQGEQARRIIPVPNVASDPRRCYTLDPETMARAWGELRASGLEVIGFYHSHPDGNPLPSKSDIALATYPDTAYLIVGLKDGAPDLAAWKIDHGEVHHLPLYVGDGPPPEALYPTTPAQRAAIIASGLLALVVTLVIALSLLPPAPEIMSTLP